MVTTTTMVIAIVVSAVLAGIVFFVLGVNYRKKIAEAEIGTAEEEATRIVSEAMRTAETKKKESVLEAKDEVYKMKSEVEKECKTLRQEAEKESKSLKQEAEKESKELKQEAQQMEKRLQAKEETLEGRLAKIEKREETLQSKIADAEAKIKEAEEVMANQIVKLEEISGYTQEQAKEHLLEALDNELTHEKAVKIQMSEQRYKEESEQKAREVIANAIQRCAADHVSEITVSVVQLPSDEMKGRIIGREGRNIRTIETLTGVDLIIDDTPEAITLSCHDSVKREVARIALEKLIQDGRIHPTRIEETVEKAAREVETKIKQDGERAVIETGVHNVHPEIMRLLGRMRYRTSYGQNVLNHSIEVAQLAGIMAAELGMEPSQIVQARRAGLLHDIGKALTHEIEGSHVDIGIDLAKKYKESQDVIHAIHAHHGDVEATTLVASLVQAADAISAARPGARRENLENYIKRLEKLEGIANDYEGVEKCFAIQAGREIRIMLKPDVISDDQMVIAAREIAKRIEDEMEYPGQIKVHVVRETRTIEYAK